MAIHVQDEETDWLVRDFAKRRGVGITAAIKLAIQEASKRDKTGAEALFERIRPIVEEVRAKQDSLARHDRAFFDENWGEKM